MAHIFISYRHIGGSLMARILEKTLTHDGYERPFLDVADLKNGPFPQKIVAAIKNCTDFIPILDPNCFDRMHCPQYQPQSDWMIREILLAKIFGKNVVPIVLPYYEWPSIDEIPEFIFELPNGQECSLKELFSWLNEQNYLEYNHQLHDAWVGRIENDFLKSPRRKVNEYSLQEALESAGIIYSIDNDGNFQTDWTFTYKGQTCPAFVVLLSKTSLVSGDEYRTVSGYFRWKGDRQIVVDVLKSSNIKWQLKEGLQGYYLVSCPYLIHPHANGNVLRDVCQHIAEILQKTIIAILQHNASEDGWLSSIGKAVGVGVAALLGLGAIAAVSSDDE